MDESDKVECEKSDKKECMRCDSIYTMPNYGMPSELGAWGACGNAGSVSVLNLGTCRASMFSVWEFGEVYNYDMYTHCLLYTSDAADDYLTV